MQTFILLLLHLWMTFHVSSCVLSAVLSTTESCLTQHLYTITVSKRGNGNFTKVQDAIDCIPHGNYRWTRVYVNPGIYWEQVIVPYDKQCIILEGESAINTKIAYDGHSATDTSSTFISSADNFVAKNICFMNTYNNPGSGQVPRGEVTQAVAASIYGDKSAFYNCGFIGYQDTLWVVSGRHFFKSCYIEGAIDFIWGNGQSFFEDCNIKVVGDGFVTAQLRGSMDETSGFVFKRGGIFGYGHTFLGRALGAYPRVVFQYTQFSNIVDPLGWDARDLVGHENDTTFAEVKCYGEGANVYGRVPWEKTLNNQSELMKYTRHLFVDEDTWINQLP